MCQFTHYMLAMRLGFEECPSLLVDSACAGTGNQAFCGFRTVYEGYLCGSQTIVTVCPLEQCQCSDQCSSTRSSLVGFTECRNCTIIPTPSTSSTPSPSVSPSPSQILPGTGSVSGRVTDQRGKPLASVELRLEPSDSRKRRDTANEGNVGWYNGELTRDRRAVQVEFTNENGDYTFVNVLPGNFAIAVNPSVEVGGEMFLIAVLALQPVFIRASTASSTIPFVFGQTGSIPVGTLNADGLPIGAATVNLFQSGNSLLVVATTSTDATTGIYTFMELPDGDFIIEFIVSSVGNGEYVVLQDGAGTASNTLSIALPSADNLVTVAQQCFVVGQIGSVYGRLRQKQTNAVVSGAIVSQGSNSQTLATTTTREGFLAFPRVGFGSAVVVVPLSVSLGESVSHLSTEVPVSLNLNSPTIALDIGYAPVEIPSNSPTPSPSSSTTATTSPSMTPSTTPTTSITITYSASTSPSKTPSVTLTSTTTNTPSATTSPTVTPSMTPTPSSTNAPSATTSPTVTPSMTPTPSSTTTPSATTSPTVTPSMTPTPSSTTTPSATTSPTVAPTPTPSSTTTPSATTSPTVTPSMTPTPSSTTTPIATTSPTVTPSMTPTPSSTTTPSATTSPTVAPSMTPTPSSTTTPSATTSPTETPSMTPTPSSTTTPSATTSPTVTPSMTPTPSSTTTPSATTSPTVTPSMTPTPSSTTTPSATTSLTVTPSMPSTPSTTTTPSVSASPQQAEDPG
ncbi:hypothetical protein SARC_08633 [Sphaeroforma arctica JP610]|uniref:SD-repeat containing protein B domain-containing protein n=1 Tax=Sphaeroforma arctica JP610 TaxID=667725 RepID=A0A0L0FQ79_9EUKA|nr:hypothetical protein SARC_08633 [Sphaeroforma arctica JP610]KNC78955.1 hypothetical protein SARC_08633 [Sphaeroforma arctica JP610]|eukprot:XP_014152857.1 hypothetical protein SARC_08633 [Sphaeroforma arctica JP610]